MGVGVVAIGFGLLGFNREPAAKGREGGVYQLVLLMT